MNKRPNGGGGVKVLLGSLTLIDSTIENCLAQGETFWGSIGGGALELSSGVIRAYRSRIANCAAITTKVGQSARGGAPACHLSALLASGLSYGGHFAIPRCVLRQVHFASLLRPASQPYPTGRIASYRTVPCNRTAAPRRGVRSNSASILYVTPLSRSIVFASSIARQWRQLGPTIHQRAGETTRAAAPSKCQADLFPAPLTTGEGCPPNFRVSQIVSSSVLRHGDPEPCRCAGLQVRPD